MAESGTRFEVAAIGKRPPAGGVLVVPLYGAPPALAVTSGADALCDGAVSELYRVKAISGEPGELAQTTRSSGYQRIVVVSLGREGALSGQQVRQAAAVAAQWLIRQGVRQAALWIDGLVASELDDAVGEFFLGAALAGFRFEAHRQTDGTRPEVIRLHVAASEGAQVKRVTPLAQRALELGAAVNYARFLAHQPANVINPATLATEAKRLARAVGLKCTVLAGEQLAKLKLGGLIAVGQGAVEGSRLIRLEYRGAPQSRQHTVLVGKSITFDTGGYSLKPTAGMTDMKFDKCGGMAVLGVMHAVARLKLKCNVTGLLAAAENVVSDRAYKVGDILRMGSGKTVEITNTDAEGRLVLADALWYAQKELKPTALIDLATLTGGVGVALGSAAAGLMSNDDALAAELGEAGRRTHERLWRLPLWDDYKDLIRSGDADIKNSSAKREAHAIVGGMFLKEFVDDGVPWAHLDIASVDSTDTGPAGSKLATGFGVRLLVDYLQRGRS